MQRLPHVYTSKVATVVVENELKPQFSSFTADDPVRNKCNGAKMAIRSGLSWGQHRVSGFEETMGLGRYLYVSEFGLFCAVKNLMICTFSSDLFRSIAIRCQGLSERFEQYHELLLAIQKSSDPSC